MNVPHDLALTGGCDSAMQGLIEQVVAAELGSADPDFDPAHPVVARAVSLGLVSRDGPRVHVVDPAFRHDAMVRVAAGMALDTWKDVDRFVSAMDNICHRGYVLGYGELGGRVLVELARRGADIISRLQEIALEAASAEARRSFWTLYASYCKALPDLDPDPEQLAIALDPMVDVVAADLASGELVGAVKRLGARSPESAEALFQAFAKRGSAPSSCLAGAVLQSLAIFDLASAHTHAVALTEAEAPALQATGILALGDLPYEEAGALREATMARLSGMLAGAGPVQGRALAHAFGALLPAERAGAGLLDLSLRADREVQQAVAEALLRTVDTSGGQNWFAEALLNVASRSAEACHRLSPLDAVAAHLVEIDPGRAAAVIGAWAAGGGTNSGSETEWKLADTFPSTLRRLRESGLDALEAAVTSWFISDDSRLHQAAADIVTAHDFDAEWDRRRPIRLSAPVLGELSKPAVRRLVLRILGYVIGGQPLAALLVSVLDRDPCPPVLVSFIGETLDHALYEYPGGAGAYLRALAESDVAPLPQREAAGAALERSTSYPAQRRELPRLAHPGGGTVPGMPVGLTAGQGTGALPGAGMPGIGPVTGLVVPVSLGPRAPLRDDVALTREFFGSDPGPSGPTLVEQMGMISGGLFRASFVVVPTLVDSRENALPREPTPKQLMAFAEAVVRSVATRMDLARFDNDGPDGIPASADDDGRIDFLVLVVETDEPFPSVTLRQDFLVTSQSGPIRSGPVHILSLSRSEVADARPALGLWLDGLGLDPGERFFPSTLPRGVSSLARARLGWLPVEPVVEAGRRVVADGRALLFPLQDVAGGAGFWLVERDGGRVYVSRVARKADGHFFATEAHVVRQGEGQVLPLSRQFGERGSRVQVRWDVEGEGPDAEVVLVPGVRADPVPLRRASP